MNKYEIKSNLYYLKSFYIQYGNSFKGIKKLLIEIEGNIFKIKDNSSKEKKFPEELNDLAIIDDFICNLKNINFENWQEKYVPSKGSIDPNYWEIVMKFENDKIVFEGVDCYPEDFDKIINILFKYSNIFNNYKDE